MDRRLTGIYLLMRELGGFRVKELEERVFTQKAIYLLQILGIDLRFRFSWYLRGPYSTHLAQSVFEIAGDKPLRDEAKKLSIRAEVKPAVDKLSGLLRQVPNSLTKSLWLELLSSIHYLRHISKAVVDRDKVGEVLRTLGKDWCTDDLAVDAWDRLESVGLIANPKVAL